MRQRAVGARRVIGIKWVMAAAVVVGDRKSGREPGARATRAKESQA